MATQTKDNSQPVGEAHVDAATAVKIGLGIEKLHQAPLLPVVWHVADTKQTLHPRWRFGDGTAVRENIKRRTAAVCTCARMAHAAKSHCVG